MKKKETMVDELVESTKNGTISFQQITDLIEMFIYLEKKLEEKDKEIALLQDNIIHFGERLKLVNDTKHRICEEIGQLLNEYIDAHRWKWEAPDGKPKIVYIPNFTIREILRKIEKGEIMK